MQSKTSCDSDTNFQCQIKMKMRCYFTQTKYSDKLCGNFVCEMQIEMNNFIQAPASLIFATIY